MTTANPSVFNPSPGFANTPRLIRLPRVMELTALPRSTIYEMMEIEAFPKAVKIGKRGIAWVEAEIIDWINNKIKNSRI